jgi:hypothetical protein
MGVGEAGAVGDKPQAHADKSPSAGSVKEFNEALGRSAGSASSTQAAAGTAAHASGGKPAIVRIDANYRSKSATATLSDGSKVPLALTKNQLAPGDTLHNLEYGPESGPEDSPVVELNCASDASCSILWTQPSDYALSPKVIVSIKQDPEEGARRRLEQLPQYIQDYVNQVGGGENLESRAKMGEDLVKAGAKKEDFAPVEIQAKAPADPDFKFVEAARKGRYSQFPSFDEFKKDLTRQVEFAKQQARTNGLNPPDPFEGAEWKDDPAAAKEKWDKYVFAQYDKAVKNEAAGLRHVGEVASMAQNAIFEALGLSAALGTGGAFLAAGGEALALPTLLESSTGVSSSTWLGTFAKFGLGISFGSNLINRGKEGIDAGSNPVSVVSAAATDTFGGKVVEKITNKSNLTGEKLNLSTGERVTGGITDLIDGGMNILGVREFAKMPGVGEPPVPRGTSAEPTGTDTPTTTSTQEQLSTGSTGVDDIAGGKGTATVGGDTASTVKPPVGDAPAGNAGKGGTGEIVSRELPGGAPHASAQPKVIVDRSAYTVEPGQAGMSKALGLDPSNTRAVALASDGHGADFHVVASPERPAGAGGRSTPPPVPGGAAGAPAAPPGDAAPLPKGSAVWFMPPGGDRARLVVVYEGKAGYMSTGSVTSRDVAGNAITKEAGKYYEIRGAQERTRFTLETTPANPIDAGGFDDKMLIFDKGWLIKGQGFTSTEVLPPTMPWNNVEFEVQGTITNPQKLNEWIRSQGGRAIGDAEPMLPDHVRVVPSKTETR